MYSKNYDHVLLYNYHVSGTKSGYTLLHAFGDSYVWAATRGGPTSECHLECHLVINIPTYHVVEHFHLYSTGYETKPKISELQ